MGNVIKRDTVLIIVEAQTNSSAFCVGEIVGNYKDEYGRWIAIDSNGKRWRNLATNLRNENYYRFINQYSISDIVYYLTDKNIDYQTVMYEMLVDAIRETLDTIQVTTLDDVYKYISQNLI